ncbi:MAG: hypothetical protein Q9190_000703 [Brigantiaea leucoxantha]
MRVFVTGAAGFIGRATVQELIQNGHQVLGLVRKDEQAQALTKAGGEPLMGDLKDIESLKTGAKAADGVIHLAFVHDFQDFSGACATDRAAIEAMGEVLAGTGKPLIIASGTLGCPKGVLATEDTEPERGHPMMDRAKSADMVYSLSKEKGIRGCVIRYSPTVHGAGDWGFIPRLIDGCRQKGAAVYTGDGSARWPAVHREDAAVLTRLVLEKGRAGATYNAVAEQSVAMKDIIGLIGKTLQLPVESQSAEEAMETLGFIGMVVSWDNPTSSDKTQKELGWHPTRPGLLADIEANYLS